LGFKLQKRGTKNQYEGLFICARRVNYFAFGLLVLVSGINLRQRRFDVPKNLARAAFAAAYANIAKQVKGASMISKVSAC